MSKVTKKQKIILEKVNPEQTYSIAEALDIMQSVKSPKFEESIDIAIRLGVDPTKSDQNVRGAVTLPNSLGNQVSVAVFADGDQAEAAKAAGAEHVGMDDLAEKFSKEEISVDVVISTNAAMKVVGKLGQVLGPKGLMPNPKTGTVSDDVATAVNNVKAGQVRFRTDKNGIIHGSIGKVSFDVTKLQTNATALIDEVKKLKPASAKGIFIGSIALSSTMGPGIKIHASELV
ncbi:50S ribosomal protein L1 [Gammaproteobacteria bacterium]|jgi:large subunit ribosomal protein L1|nr:50S ribosomal protein L1 [Gammaproteobacteria bacterium]MDB4120234.1 50S ribosomal protein L1 [Gammaproteobacteria bacterium]MDB4135867.1 50S ribosomal protein L1 [Gammaproteobacteria bacterium]MDB4158530.1 50S ribosomal protein L1 [Gammaproteobacteria bacterium]MDB9747709.1 50S ribosomal protein L1 [Gammaproteobacteria bacterium]